MYITICIFKYKTVLCSSCNWCELYVAMDAVQPNLKVTNEAQLERFIVQKFAKAFIPMPDRSIKRSGWLAPFPLARELALVTSQNSSCFSEHANGDIHHPWICWVSLLMVYSFLNDNVFSMECIQTIHYNKHSFYQQHKEVVVTKVLQWNKVAFHSRPEAALVCGDICNNQSLYNILTRRTQYYSDKYQQARRAPWP